MNKFFGMMKNGWYKIWMTMITVMPIACKEVYNPPINNTNSNYLVVDGTLNAGQDSTVIKLSRTRKLNDTVGSIPEAQALVTVIGENGGTIQLYEQGNGKYVTDQMNLNTNEKYQLKIVTGDGKEYLSDPVTVKITPAIDSISWRQDSVGVQIYVNTHDPQNNTRYYKWDYTETWKYRTEYETLFDVQNEQVVVRLPDQRIYFCWQSDNSTEIAVATSSKLSQDIIFQNPIAQIPENSEKLSIKYSILVRQHAISAESYDYWENLKKNTEQLGTLFDAQPSQITGNVHCTSNPEEPVLGYVDAATVQTQRIFIDNQSLGHWDYFPYYSECEIKGFRDDDNPPENLNHYFPPTGPRYNVLTGTDRGTYLYTSLRCADCRDHGGTNVQPPFWP